MHEHTHMSAKKCGRIRSVIKLIEKEHEQDFHPAFIVGIKIEHPEFESEEHTVVFSIMLDPDAADIEEIAALKEKADELFGELDDARDDNSQEGEPGFIVPRTDESEPS